MHPLSAAYSLPLYAQLAELLRHRISRGDWKEGGRLPSHELLTREFAVARVTVRQAITLPEDGGLLRSHQGRGTFVTARPGAERPLPVHSSLRDLAAMLRGAETQLLNLSKSDAAPGPAGGGCQPEPAPHPDLLAARATPEWPRHPVR